MTEQKQPQAGEWWQKDLTRLFIIGTKKNGLAVGETEFGTLIPFLKIHDWQHLPECDSFDWQPVEFCVMCDDLSAKAHARCNDCTEFALDAVRAPVESPDDWVTQDRVPVRLADEIQWSGMASLWHKISKQGDVFRNKLKHGSVTKDRGTLSVRCRRKDLPPVESPKRVPVRLWTHRNALRGSSCRVIAQSRPIDDCNIEIHSDGNGGWYVESEVQP